MSKAFVREDDETPDDPVMPSPPSMLPPGAKNFLTPGGAARLRVELAQLAETERPKLTGRQDDPDAKRELQRLDQRIRYLRQSLIFAEVVAAPAPPHDQVKFGATVTVRDPHGDVSRYRIVGVDEIDLERGWVSWLTPIARALHLAKLGDRVSFKTRVGVQELEIVDVTYESGDA
jgi:transcription elongation factor GreB